MKCLYQVHEPGGRFECVPEREGFGAEGSVQSNGRVCDIY